MMPIFFVLFLGFFLVAVRGGGGGVLDVNVIYFGLRIITAFSDRKDIKY